MHVTGIRRYPVKSCRGESLDSALVEPWGLAGDRRWMVVDPDRQVVTAREANRLFLVHPRITADGLRLGAPGRPDLDVRRPAADLGDALDRVSIWDSELDAAPAGPEADAWLSAFLERPVRLVHLDDPTRREVDPDFGEATDRVSFADGYPLLLTTEESLTALNDEIARGRLPEQGPLPMLRFRANVVLAGAEPWAEDDWRRLRVGDAVFRLVKGCARCVMTTLDPETAARGKEPLTTLARVRRYDKQTWFGVNLIPDSAGATLRVGDEAEVLEAVAPGAGPLRRGVTARGR